MFLTHRLSRRLRLVVTGVAIATAGLLGLTAGTANASVNTTFGPHYTFPYGDCNVTVGNVAQQDFAAVGGTDILCGHYRGYIIANVYLYRWNGYSWGSPVASSGWQRNNNSRSLSVQTWPPYRGCGKAYWDDVVVVNVDGYQRTFDLYNGIGYYAQYDPCHPFG